MAASKRPAVIDLCASEEEEDERARSKRLTRERRESRRAAAGTAAASAATPGSTYGATSSSSASASASASASGASTSTSASATHSSSSAATWAQPRAAVTCPICFCETEPAEACVLAASCGCAFCVDCLSTYVRGKVEAGEVTAEQLVCPAVEPRRCGVPLTPQDVQRCLPAGQAERYDRLALQRCVEAQDDLGRANPPPPPAAAAAAHAGLRLRHRHCPTAGCPFVFAWEPDNRKLECPLCSKSFCLLCRAEPWHTGMRCEQFQAERGDPEASDAAFAQFASSQRLKQCAIANRSSPPLARESNPPLRPSARCPKCRWWVEKSSGCDAMHCRCNLVFCYKCGGDDPPTRGRVRAPPPEARAASCA
jgi:hypothetical protein